MIFNYWKNVMGFAFAPLYIKSSFVKKIAPIAIPVIGVAIAGPLGLSVAAGAAAKAVCPDMTVLSKESALTVPAAGLIVPTAFA